MPLPPIPDTILVVETSSPVYTVGRRDTSHGLAASTSASENREPARRRREEDVNRSVGRGDGDGDLFRNDVQAGGGSDGALQQAEVVKLRRGGGLTYHGPGQVTVYPIVNVQRLWRACGDPGKGPSPVRWYSDVLERALVDTCRGFGLPAHGGCTGAWVPRALGDTPVTGGEASLLTAAQIGTVEHAAATEQSTSTTSCPLANRTTGGPSKSIASTAGSRKVGSIGLQLSDWVSMHGVNLNVTEAPVVFFDRIVMCEQPDRRATSLHRELLDRRRANTLMPTCARGAVGRPSDQNLKRLSANDDGGALMMLLELPTISAVGMAVVENIIKGLGLEAEAAAWVDLALEPEATLVEACASSCSAR
jgi:lipoate-protein ligase B